MTRQHVRMCGALRRRAYSVRARPLLRHPTNLLAANSTYIYMVSPCDADRERYAAKIKL